jgi:hypothetical protein
MSSRYAAFGKNNSNPRHHRSFHVGFGTRCKHNLGARNAMSDTLKYHIPGIGI